MNGGELVFSGEMEISGPLRGHLSRGAPMGDFKCRGENGEGVKEVPKSGLLRPHGSHCEDGEFQFLFW